MWISCCGVYTAGLGFYLKGVLYPNNSIVNIEDIGAGANALHCITDRVKCCKEASTGGWYQPGMDLPLRGSRAANFSRSRAPSAVLLNRRNNATSPIGLYRCKVLDSRGVNQSVYIGVYGASDGKQYY